MKKDVVIKVENLSKKYTIGKRNQYITLREKLIELPAKLFKKEKKKEFWALKGINFEVKKGEVLGIIGRNGAGKSTLLKILSKIVEPTMGKVTMKGKIASLLEVGTGFNPELTGRDNIYLNGAILGMSKKEIDKKFNQIVEFSGIESFLDTPVKRYSSGMYVRLAFSVAAHLESEILLVDEVLAVGDLEFQKKCLGKMNSLAKSGRTVIFVSHNMNTIQDLCEKTILVEKGKVLMLDLTSKVRKKYQENTIEEIKPNLSNRKDRQGTGDIIFTKIKISGDKTHGDTIRSGSNIKVQFTYKIIRPEKLPKKTIIQFSILDYKAATICYVSNRITNESINTDKKINTATCYIKKLTLNRGKFTINAYIGSLHKKLDYVVDICEFTVMPGDFYSSGKLPESTHSTTLLEYNWR